MSRRAQEKLTSHSLHLDLSLAISEEEQLVPSRNVNLGLHTGRNTRTALAPEPRVTSNVGEVVVVVCGRRARSLAVRRNIEEAHTARLLDSILNGGLLNRRHLGDILRL